MQLTRLMGKIFHLHTDVVRKLEDKDEEYLENFVDVTEGANGRMIIGVLQALDDARRISKRTFQVTTVIELITIVANLYFLFIGGSHFSFLTIFISVGAWIFAQTVFRENREFAHFVRQGFGWEDVTITGNKAVISIRGYHLDVDVVRMSELTGDLLDVAGRKLYTKD